MNFILNTDSYKLSHFLGYPADAEHVYSYAESRGGVYPATVFFGLQKFIRELADVRITWQDIAEAQEFAKMHGVPFNFDGWMSIVDDYNGCIPVEIKAVPEGTLVPTSNVLVTVENTDPRHPWLTSYIETALLRAVWYPTTVATRIHGMKQKIKPFFDDTSDSGNMDFALLDFSARGTSSLETAAVGGMAHLISFMGSDNIPAVLAARNFYDAEMAGFSVAATEHSVTTSWGRNGEIDSIEYLIENMMPKDGVLSLVADTYNVYEYVDRVSKFQDRIANKGGTVVIRPDSGEMKVVLPRVIRNVRDKFWKVQNAKGFYVPKYVKVLQGDGINEETCAVPFSIARDLLISSDSIMVGSGGGLMQANIDRDTSKFAFKASNVTRSGMDIPIRKDPITDPGKRSKEGKLKLIKDYAGYNTVRETAAMSLSDELRRVYRNGWMHNQETLGDIRTRLNNQ